MTSILEIPEHPNYIEIAATPYHRQNGTDDCGEACMQMVLAYLGPDTSQPGVLHSQEALARVQRGHTTIDERFGWGTNPLDMVWTLNYYALHDGTRLSDAIASGRGRFELVELNTEWQLSNLLKYTIDKGKGTGKNAPPPPIVLVWGQGHWVVVYGYDAFTRKTTTQADDEFGGFYIHNSAVVRMPGPSDNALPAQYSQQPAPPIAHSHDDSCGIGGLWNYADTRVTYKHWCQFWDTGVPKGGPRKSHWEGKHLAVVFRLAEDRKPPASRMRKPKAATSALGQPRGGAKRSPKKPVGIPAMEAAKEAADQLHELGLFSKPKPWSGYLDLQKTKAVSARMVGPNNSLSGFLLHYYLVELVYDEQEAAQVLAMVHPETKELLATAVIKTRELDSQPLIKPMRSLSGPFAIPEPLRRILGFDFEAILANGYAKLDDGRPQPITQQVLDSSTLTWNYSPSSRSPFFPLRDLQFGPHKVSIPMFAPIRATPVDDQRPHDPDAPKVFDFRPFIVDTAQLAALATLTEASD
jgi:hypothetical protein